MLWFALRGGAFHVRDLTHLSQKFVGEIGYKYILVVQHSCKPCEQFARVSLSLLQRTTFLIVNVGCWA